MAGGFGFRYAGMIAIAVCLGVMYAAPSATAGAPHSHPGSPDHRVAHNDKPDESHGKAHVSRGKAHVSHGKAHESHGAAHVSDGAAHESHGAAVGERSTGDVLHTDDYAARPLAREPESRGRDLALGPANPPAPEPGSRGLHLALGPANPAAAEPGSRGRHLALGHQNHPPTVAASRGHHLTPGHLRPASKRQRRLPGPPGPKRLNPHARDNTAPPSGARKASRQLPPRPRAAPPFRNPRHPTGHHRPHQNRGEHQPHHPSKQHTAEPNPHKPRPRSLSTPIPRQLLRPGSPAMVLSLIVVMCLVGTAVVVSMARRRPSKPTH